MAKKDINDLRNAFQRREKPDNSRPNNYFPFWQMPNDEQCRIRFLPDANEDNPLGFLVEKWSHTLYINGSQRKVPCLKTYGKDNECPICKVSQDYYKADDKKNGSRYWRRPQYIAQALIMEHSLPRYNEEDPYTGQVKLIPINPTIYKIIRDAFGSGELDYIPYDYQNGTDFIIKKTKQGDYPDYTLSKFARKETALDDEVVELVKEQLVDLSTVLPNEIPKERLEEMLEADLSGGDYDPEKSPKASSDDNSDDGDDDFKSKVKENLQDSGQPTSGDDDSDNDGDDVDEDEVENIFAKIRNRDKNQE